MKRRPKHILAEGPSKVFSMFCKNFEFLELSICAASVKVEYEEPSYDGEQNVVRNLTVDEIGQLDFRQAITMETFNQILLCIGQCVKSVRILNGNAVILPKVEKHCKNMDRIELLEGEGSHSLENFRGLTEMKVPNVRIATHSFRKCLANNPSLESLEFDHFWYENDVTDLSELLPDLRRLRLVEVAMGEDGQPNQKSKKRATSFDYSVIPELLKADGLTHFSFESEKNCNELLRKLSGKRNLESLSFKMNVNSETFTNIGELKSLKCLAITNHKQIRNIRDAHPIWPSKLTHLTLNSIVIPKLLVLSIINKLKHLEELHIGATNAHVRPWLDNETAHLEIDEILRSDGRTLKIFYSDTVDVNATKYKSATLEIINEFVVNMEVKPLRITISC